VEASGNFTAGPDDPQPEVGVPRLGTPGRSAKAPSLTPRQGSPEVSVVAHPSAPHYRS
jgi:hypothetical protein